MKTNTIFARILLLAVAGLLASCSTTESGSNPKKSGPIAIEKGMSTEALIAAIGEPMEVREVDPPQENIKIWVYEQKKVNVKSTATGTKETPYINPITGAVTSIQDITYSQERETLELTTEILIGEGVVLGWKQETRRDNSIVD